MHTYLFTYNQEIDGFGSTEFCAETLEEAKTLFEDWFESEYNMHPQEYYIERVYNKEDAEEYGAFYS